MGPASMPAANTWPRLPAARLSWAAPVAGSALHRLRQIHQRLSIGDGEFCACDADHALTRQAVEEAAAHLTRGADARRHFVQSEAARDRATPLIVGQLDQ